MVANPTFLVDQVRHPPGSHKPVSYPRASGPRFNPRSIFCRSSALSLGLRPARPAFRKPGNPGGLQLLRPAAHRLSMRTDLPRYFGLKKPGMSLYYATLNNFTAGLC
jgi:hypothetical protein